MARLTPASEELYHGLPFHGVRVPLRRVLEMNKVLKKTQPTEYLNDVHILGSNARFKVHERESSAKHDSKRFNGTKIDPLIASHRSVRKWLLGVGRVENRSHCINIEHIPS